MPFQSKHAQPLRTLHSTQLQYQQLWLELTVMGHSRPWLYNMFCTCSVDHYFYCLGMFGVKVLNSNSSLYFQHTTEESFGKFANAILSFIDWYKNSPMCSWCHKNNRNPKQNFNKKFSSITSLLWLQHHVMSPEQRWQRMI